MTNDELKDADAFYVGNKYYSFAVFIKQILKDTKK